MADTSYLSRVIYKELENAEDLENVDFNGDYKLLVRAKSIPSPIQPPNTVESTTLEDDTQTFEMGIKTADAIEITGNLEKKYIDNLEEVKGKKLCLIHLYGTDGIGSTMKVAYVGQAIATVSDVGGVDEILEMSVTVVENTSPVVVTDSFTVTDNGDGTFNVAAA